MLKYIFWALAIYFLVRFIFNFVIPVVRASRRMREQMKEFQEKANHQQGQDQFNGNTGPNAPGRPKENSTSKAGDYIDFEEIRER